MSPSDARLSNDAPHDQALWLALADPVTRDVACDPPSARKLAVQRPALRVITLTTPPIAPLPKMRALRPAHDFDAIDAGGRQVRGVEPAAERVERHAVDQHERVVGFAAARKDRRDRAAAAICHQAEAGYQCAAVGGRSRSGARRDPRDR